MTLVGSFGTHNTNPSAADNVQTRGGKREHQSHLIGNPANQPLTAAGDVANHDDIKRKWPKNGGARIVGANACHGRTKQNP